MSRVENTIQSRCEKWVAGQNANYVATRRAVTLFFSSTNGCVSLARVIPPMSLRHVKLSLCFHFAIQVSTTRVFSYVTAKKNACCNDRGAPLFSEIPQFGTSPKNQFGEK